MDNELSDSEILDKEGEILEEFARNFADNMVDTPPEIQQVINENFWELISNIGEDHE